MPKTKNFRFDLPENLPDLIKVQAEEFRLLVKSLEAEFIALVDPSPQTAIKQFLLSERLRYRHLVLSQTIRDRGFQVILNATRKQMGELWGQHQPGQREASMEIPLPQGFPVPRCIVHFFWKPNQKRNVPCEFRIDFPDDEVLKNLADQYKTSATINDL